jgi:hypothetical protein
MDCLFSFICLPGVAVFEAPIRQLMFRKPWLESRIPMTPELIDDCVFEPQEWRDQQKSVYREWHAKYMRFNRG